MFDWIGSPIRVCVCYEAITRRAIKHQRIIGGAVEIVTNVLCVSHVLLGGIDTELCQLGYSISNIGMSPKHYIKQGSYD